MAEHDGTVTLMTQDGIELCVPVERFVDEIENDICELDYLSQRTIELSLANRFQNKRFATRLGPHSLLLTDCEVSDPLVEDLLESSLLQYKLFGESDLILLHGIRAHEDPLAKAIASLGKGCLISRTRMGFPRFSFTGTGSFPNLDIPELLSEGGLENFEISAFVQIMEGLNQGSYESIGQWLQIDEVEDIRRFFEYSSENQGGRLVHAPRTEEGKHTAIKAFKMYMKAGLVDWLSQKRSKQEDPAQIPVVEIPRDSVDEWSWSRLENLYLKDCLLGGSMSAMFEKPLMGLFDLLEASNPNQSEIFLSKLCACNPGVFEQVGEGTMVLLRPYSNAVLDAQELLLSIEIARRAAVWSCSRNRVVEWILRRQVERSPISIHKRWTSKSQEKSIVGALRLQGIKFREIHASSKRIRNIYNFENLEKISDPHILEIAKTGKRIPFSLSLTETEYNVRYASLGVRMEPWSTGPPAGVLHFTPDQERSMNTALLSIRKAASVVLTSTIARWREQKQLHAKSFSLIRIQRWIRKIFGNGAPPLRSRMWNEILALRRREKETVDQLQAEIRRLTLIIHEKDFVIHRLSEVRARDVWDAEEGFSDPVESVRIELAKERIRSEYLQRRLDEKCSGCRSLENFRNIARSA